jgi:hypothetical protein
MVHNREALLTTNWPFKFQVHMATHEARMHHNYCVLNLSSFSMTFMVVMRVAVPLTKEKNQIHLNLN